jgi:hypothetical protein
MLEFLNDDTGASEHLGDVANDPWFTIRIHPWDSTSLHSILISISKFDVGDQFPLLLQNIYEVAHRADHPLIPSSQPS